MNTLPSPLRIGAFDFTLEFFPKGEEPDDRVGECDTRVGALSMRVLHGMEKVRLLDTVLHEILHAIYFAHNIEGRDGEERTVTMLATAWAQVYRDNPHLLRWLTKAAK